MAGAETTEVFNCSPTELYSIVSDYPNYPKFLSEVTKCLVVKEEGGRKLVEFQIFLIKNFAYRLWITEKPGKGIEWEFESGDLFKISNGYWRLAEESEGRVRATYGVDAKFKMFVPGPIAKALVNVNLPNMMASYHKRVKELYGK
ncbi:MAG: SRPBCC family protein [Bdellovibrionaceae bacterium]|nr:SRPBCC family protein [Bdellovibrionales bacterium]MCB9083932.1 SRPBCC family protein [Pseudobdellovibrionaceae bacterium]